MRKIILLLLFVTTLAACGGDKEIPIAVVRRGTISESFTEPARTRLEVRHRVSMPVTGDVARIELKPGDSVARGQRLFEIDLVPLAAAVREAEATVAQLEAELAIVRDTTIEEAELANAEAQILAAVASVEAERVRQEDLRLREERLLKEYNRLLALQEGSAVSERDLDDARLAANTATVARRAGEATLAQLQASEAAARAVAQIIRRRIERKELEARSLAQQAEQARARLDRAAHDLALANVPSPVDGIVLERYEIGGGPLMAGTPVMLVGTLDELEVEADVLTQDAYRLTLGATVDYTVSAGSAPLRGRVTRIDPSGFTKFSSLGVEQQRVIVISSLDDRPENLGLGFRVLARYTKGTREDALIIPRSAILEDPDGTRYVFRINNGRVERANIQLGLRGDFEIEVTDGLRQGDRLIMTPDSTTKIGMRI